jgi:hypothetical protein
MTSKLAQGSTQHQSRFLNHSAPATYVCLYVYTYLFIYLFLRASFKDDLTDSNYTQSDDCMIVNDEL